MGSSPRRARTGRHPLLVCSILGAAACGLPSDLPPAGFVDPAAEPVLLAPEAAVTFRSSFVLNLSTGSGG
jgi:hypothetical protein